MRTQKIICGISTTFLKRNSEVRRALFETKKVLNDNKLKNGEIRGIQYSSLQEHERKYAELKSRFDKILIDNEIKDYEIENQEETIENLEKHHLYNRGKFISYLFT